MDVQTNLINSGLLRSAAGVAGATLLGAAVSLLVPRAAAMPPLGDTPGASDCASARFFTAPPDRTGADLAAIFNFDGFKLNGGSTATGWSVARCTSTDGTTWLQSYGTPSCPRCFTGPVPGTVGHGKAPVIRSLSGTARDGHTTALVHRTARFRFFVSRVLGPPARRRVGGKVVLADSEAPLGEIGLGKLHAGVAHFGFRLALHGKTLAPGRYNLILQALKPTGQLKSQSTALYFTIGPGGALKPTRGLNGG